MKKSTCIVMVVAFGASFGNFMPAANAGPWKEQITAESVREGLVLHLSFDQDETKGKITDMSGKANQGTATGVQWTPDGRKGGAYEFRADGDRIEVPNTESLNPKHLTLAAWIKTATADGHWRRIIDKSYSQGYALSMAADWQGNQWNGMVSMEIGPDTHFMVTRSKVADGKWHYVASTFDGTEELLYVDGKPEGQALIWGSPGRAGTNGLSLLIGCNRADAPATGFCDSFRGVIDEPMIWNRALSPKEVAFLYASTSGEPKPGKSVQAPTESLVDQEAAIPLLQGIVHLTDDDIRFRTADGMNVFVDPVSWPTDELVIKSGMIKPDLILITHPHGDHLQPTMLREYMNLNPKAILAGPADVIKVAKQKGIEQAKVLTIGESYLIAGVHFSTVPAYFIEGDSHPKASQWLGYILQINGANYYVTGDTQPLPEMAKYKVDVLFPLLSGCGGNLEQAVKMAHLCKPQLVVPVHTSGRVETIKKYLAQLPKGLQGAYYQDANLISGPELGGK